MKYIKRILLTVRYFFRKAWTRLLEGLDLDWIAKEGQNSIEV